MAHPRHYRTGKLVFTDNTDRYWFDKGFNDALLKIRPRNKKQFYLYGYREGKHYAETVAKHMNPGAGKAFTFHGSATSKLAAEKLKAKVPGSFIEEKDGRYYILKPKKIPTATFYDPRNARRNSGVPKGAVKIYGRCLRIEAVKLVSHTYGGKPTPAGQKYFHDFTTKNAMIYGLPDGSLLIKAR